MYTTFNFPTVIRFGAGVIEELGPHLAEQGIRKPLLVTDPGCVELPFFIKIVNDLSSEGLAVEVFSKLHKNPVESDVISGAQLFRDVGCDAVVGVGGGVALDVARAIVLAAYHTEPLFTYEEAVGGDALITDKVPYFVCVPTTSGTGSEVGRSAVISDDTTKAKKLLFSPHLLAKRVFADPALTMDLPAPITAATGVDALTHGIEAYLAKGYHPMCDGIALECIRLVWDNLNIATKSPTIEARANMMAAAMMGAVAFQKGLGVIHSCAHPLSTLFDTHHGLANAVMLPYGVAFNREACPKRVAVIEQIIGGDAVETLKDFVAGLGLPTTLGPLGVCEGDIDSLADVAIDDVCHANNPRVCTRDDFVNIYKAAL